MPTPHSAALLIFDGDCGACTASALFAAERLPDSVSVTAWQEIPDLGALDLTVDDVTTAAYWIGRDGRQHRGELAIAKALVAMGGAWAIAGREIQFRPTRWVAAWVYPVIARHRHRLPGGTASCRMPAAGDG